MTKHQMQVYTLIIEGKSNNQIGAELGLSEKTVKFHATSIYKCHNVKSRAELIVKCQKSQIDKVVKHHQMISAATSYTIDELLNALADKKHTNLEHNIIANFLTSLAI